MQREMSAKDLTIQ
jgi:hypothetical protein